MPSYCCTPNFSKLWSFRMLDPLTGMWFWRFQQKIKCFIYQKRHCVWYCVHEFCEIYKWNKNSGKAKRSIDCTDFLRILGSSGSVVNWPNVIFLVILVLRSEKWYSGQNVGNEMSRKFTNSNQFLRYGKVLVF